MDQSGDGDQEELHIVEPVFSTIKKEENVFKLAKTSGNEARMTQFLVSCR